jgi:hypothetical protein
MKRILKSLRLLLLLVIAGVAPLASLAMVDSGGGWRTLGMALIAVCMGWVVGSIGATDRTMVLRGQ